MIRLGLLGRHISHSLSPKIYEGLLSEEHSFKLLDKEREEDLPSVQELAQNFDGIHITSPYKRVYIEKCHRLESDYGELGINCLKFQEGEVIGTNTDAMAMEKEIDRFVQEEFNSFLILGNGVMSEVLQRILKHRNLSFHYLSRREKNLKSHTDLSGLNETNIVVTHACERDFLFQGKLPKKSLFWNLNYNCPLQKDKVIQQGVTYQDGLELLYLQAFFGAQFFSLKIDSTRGKAWFSRLIQES